MVWSLLNKTGLTRLFSTMDQLLANDAKTKSMKTAPLTLCIVEDDPTYQHLLLSYMNVLGHTAQGFYSGEEFLKQVHDKPDVVILDHHLGGELQGVDVLQILKREHRDTPVIYVTGEESITLVSNIFRNGSQDFIFKDSASLLRLKLSLDKIAQAKRIDLKTKAKLKIRFMAFIMASVSLVIFLLYLIII